MSDDSHMLNIAQKEAARLGHNFVGTEHVLLGILEDEEGIASILLRFNGVKSEAVRSELEKKPAYSWTAREGEIPFTPRMKTVLQNSWEQVRMLGGNRIAAEHVLLSILSQDEGQAAIIFKILGVDAQALREKLRALLRSS